MRQSIDLATIARRIGGDLDQAALELMQSRLISSLFSRAVNREVILKGGMAMRLAAQSRRLTKDVDLQASGSASMNRIAELVRHAVDDLKSLGVLDEIVVTEPKQTETTQRWKVNGRLQGGESRVSLTVEVSRRGSIDASLIKPVRFVPSDDLKTPPAIVETLCPSAIAIAKLEALSSKVREAPRDIFDLDVLISMQVKLPLHLFSEIYSEEELLDKLDTINQKLEKMDFDTVRDELLPSLPKDRRDSFNASEWDRMRINTMIMAETWFNQAIALKHGQAAERQNASDVVEHTPFEIAQRRHAARRDVRSAGGDLRPGAA